MSDKYTKLFHSLDGDDDFNALSIEAQHLYMRLLAHPSINYAGVIDWRPNRWVHKWPTATREGLRAAADELRDAHFAYFDDDTEEVMIRSFTKRDGILKSPNMTVAMRKAHQQIASPSLKRVFLWVLQSHHSVAPELAGWAKVLDMLERPVSDPATDEAVNPSVYPCGNPSGKGSGNPSVKGSPKASGNPSGNPPPTPNTKHLTPDTASGEPLDRPRSTKTKGDEPDGFAEFWEAYNLKRDRAAAVKAYRKALTKTDASTLLQAATEFVRFESQRPDYPQFVPYASTWLNKERWNDERAGRASSQASTSRPAWDEIPVPPDDGTPEELAEWHRANDERKRARMAGQA